MIYANINVHSYYSLLDSILSIDDIINISLENNLNYAILTDVNLYGAIEFYQKCKKNNLKPIIGLEININNSIYILIAKNIKGFKTLVKISSNNDKLKYLNQESEKDIFIILKSGNNILNKINIWDNNDIYINEVKYKNDSDYFYYDILKSINNEEKIQNINKNPNSKYSWIKSININEIQKNNFKKIIDETNILIENLNSNKLPIYDLNKNSKQYLEKIAINGLIEKLNINDNKIPKKYYDRLMYELSVINSLKYDDYFLIVSDFVNFAKKNNIIIGPGRGSAAGSLVSFALNITEIDPIKYNLIFERFLNKDRKTLPDIDIDVMDSRRDELIEYIFNKYKIENTSQIITFQRIKYKMAIRDVGRVLNIPLNLIDNITKKIPSNLETSLIDFVKQDQNLNVFYHSYPDLFEISNKLFNIPRQFSTHAAGILIANQEIDNIIPTINGTNGYKLSQWTMEYLEMFGLNKIDILGLKNLTIISDTIESIKKRYNKTIDLKKINLEDQNIFNEVKKANTIGIFQLESPGMRSTLTKIQPNNLEDISITSALFRPGPQQMINKYVETRKNNKKIEYLNEDFEKILSSTNGFCIYQEQVIELIKVVAGFDTAKADIFRRAISKKKIELFDEMKNDFFIGAKNNNYNDEQIENIYKLLIEFTNYGFNHSHSLAYSLISYWMLFLKYYYPLEFMMSLLKNDSGVNLKNNIYISEAKKCGIAIHNIDINHSDATFKIWNDGILLGFSTIKGFGIEIINKLLNIRNNFDFSTYENAIANLSKNKISNKNIEILIKIGAFDNYEKNRNFLLQNLDRIIKKNEAIDPITKKPIFDIEYKDIDDISDEIKAEYENNYLGYSFSNNENQKLFNKYMKEYELYQLSNKNKPETFNVLVQIKNLKKMITRTKHEMCFISLKDNDLDYSIPCFSPKIFDNLKLNNFYILKIREKNNKYDIIDLVLTL